MSHSPRNFDRLARWYRALEYLALGHDLERARFALLAHLQDCRHILILGEGDGRCLEKLVALAPNARIDCHDRSEAMLACARKRLRGKPHQVTFHQTDILTDEFPEQHYDAVITCFFLDCFTPPQASEIIAKVSRSLRSGAHWLWADFALPPQGLARVRAKIWLAMLYRFFRWQTDLSARELPESEAMILDHGFQEVAHTTLQWGLLRSSVYRLTADRSDRDGRRAEFPSDQHTTPKREY